MGTISVMNMTHDSDWIGEASLMAVHNASFNYL